MIKLVAFDWNGTILSDTIATWESDNRTLIAIGHKPISLQKFRETFNIPIVDYYVANGLDRKYVLGNSKKIDSIYHPNYEERAKNVRTRSGAREILRWLDKNSIPAIIYSNHTITGIDFHLERLGIKKYISRVLALPKVGKSMKIRHKDQMLRDYIHSTDLDSNDVVSVGDTCEEIEISKELGLHSVALSGGFVSTARLRKSKPDFLIHNLTELKGIIIKLNG